MADKSQIIQLIKECIRLEQNGIQLYSQHLESPDFFQKFSPEDSRRVQKTLRIMAEESLSHRRIFETLLDKAEDPDGTR